MDIKPRIWQQKWQLEHHNVSNYYSSVPIISTICGENFSSGQNYTLNFMNATGKCENRQTSENALLGVSFLGYFFINFFEALHVTNEDWRKRSLFSLLPMTPKRCMGHFWYDLYRMRRQTDTQSTFAYEGSMNKAMHSDLKRDSRGLKKMTWTNNNPFPNVDIK